MTVDDDITFGGESIQFTDEFSTASALNLLRELAREHSEARQAFHNNPREAFEAHGIIVSDKLLPGNRIVLPPVHEIKELLYYLGGEDEFSEVGEDPPLGFSVYILVWAFKMGGP
jgi:hypothetical protein